MNDGAGESGWISWTSDSWGDLPPQSRDSVRRTMIERHRERGALAAVVHVRVYADGVEPYVSFTEECTLGPDADREEIAAVVERARLALADWS
ncbi:MAG TPA: hypothetical protein VK773_12725 [Acidimicrobiales bacterium]|jgi:hypothetical protein|nr:hypothetical protein [Acidimicrobiales bacterium]